MESNIKNKNDKFLVLWMFMLLFMTDISYITINSGSHISEITDFFFIILCFLMIIKNRRMSKLIILISVSLVCTIILTNSIFALSYYSFICKIWICYYFAKRYTIEAFADCYLLVMRIVAIGSLICWLFPKFFVNLSFFPQFVSSRGSTYRFLGVATIPFASHMQRRNFGPYWEPGTYQVYLCVALFLLLFVSEKKNKVFDLLLFILVEMTTLSGAALIPAGIMVAAYLLKEKNMKAFFAALSGCVLLAILFNTGLFDSILKKMSGTDSNSSYMFRWIGFEGAIRNFLMHPLFGSSFTEGQQVRDNLALQYLGISYGSNANTFANYFGYYGLFVGVFFLLSSYGFFKKICDSRMVCFIAFMGYFLSTSNENLINSLLIIVIALLGKYGQYRYEAISHQ